MPYQRLNPQPAQNMCVRYDVTVERENGEETCNYDSMHNHRSDMGLGKDLWLDQISRDDECEIFEKAFSKRWVCDGGYLWSFGNCPKGRQVLGHNEGRIAQFKRDIAAHPWHGQPRVTLPGKIPPKSILKAWTGELDKSFLKRLKKRKV